jgi:hypothetical protein
MANSNIYYSTTTDFANGVPNYSVPSQVSQAGGSKENRINNPNTSIYYGLFRDSGEFRNAIKSYVIHVLGWGYECQSVRNKVLLDHISGNGKETFWKIMYKHLRCKKWNGDAFTQIIKDDDGDLLNLKNLDPNRTAIITDENSIILRFEYTQADGTVKKLKPEEVLYSSNDPEIDEPLGVAETEAVKWVIEAMIESGIDQRRMMHFDSVRVLYVDETDTTRLAKLKTELASGIKNGNVVILTCKPEEAKFEDLVVPPIDAFIRYQNWLEGKFYSQLGISKVSIGGTTENNTEASAKVNMVITEPVWIKEITELETDIKNQIGIEIKINRQPSLMDNMQTDEAANTGQTKLEYQGSQ